MRTIISVTLTVKALKTSKLIVTQLCQQFHMFCRTHILLVYSRTLQLITDLTQMKSLLIGSIPLCIIKYMYFTV